MKSILPIILVILLLTGAITYALAKRAIPKRVENRFGIAANQLTGQNGDVVTPTPTQKALSGLIVTPTATLTPTPTAKPTPTPTTKPTPTVLPVVSETATKSGSATAEVSSTKTTKTVRTTKTTICTPVYGMANTCTEHVVVDTGAADAIFFNFAGLAYVAGLTSFIKAKTLKK